MTRAALYIDGFNLYHSIDDLGDANLKWLNLWHLGQYLSAERSLELQKAVYCSAYRISSYESKSRHKIYISALESVNVESIIGHYVVVPTPECENCGFFGEKPNEKQSDINVALSVFNDARNDVFDTAFIVSADSDQAATARFMKDNFPEKSVVFVAPPLKSPPEKAAGISGTKVRKLSEQDIRKCLFPINVMREDKPPLRRPAAWD